MPLFSADRWPTQPFLKYCPAILLLMLTPQSGGWGLVSTHTDSCPACPQFYSNSTHFVELYCGFSEQIKPLQPIGTSSLSTCSTGCNQGYTAALQPVISMSLQHRLRPSLLTFTTKKLLTGTNGQRRMQLPLFVQFGLSCHEFGLPAQCYSSLPWAGRSTDISIAWECSAVY